MNSESTENTHLVLMLDAARGCHQYPKELSHISALWRWCPPTGSENSLPGPLESAAVLLTLTALFTLQEEYLRTIFGIQCFLINRVA